MKPEEFEVYVIPPNFMEGGTLFGGLLKTRNTIEAVILGLAVGVPVLHLPLRRSSLASRLAYRFCTFRFPSPSAL